MTRQSGDLGPCASLRSHLISIHTRSPVHFPRCFVRFTPYRFPIHSVATCERQYHVGSIQIGRASFRSAGKDWIPSRVTLNGSAYIDARLRPTRNPFRHPAAGKCVRAIRKPAVRTANVSIYLCGYRLYAYPLQQCLSNCNFCYNGSYRESSPVGFRNLAIGKFLSPLAAIRYEGDQKALMLGKGNDRKLHCAGHIAIASWDDTSETYRRGLEPLSREKHGWWIRSSIT